MVKVIKEVELKQFKELGSIGHSVIEMRANGWIIINADNMWYRLAMGYIFGHGDYIDFILTFM